MPMHDWTRVDAGLYHAFHHRWIDALCDLLNGGALPADHYALPEQRIGGPIPDVLTLRLDTPGGDPGPAGGGVAVSAAPPRTRHSRRRDTGVYAGRANRVTVRHRHGDVVAVVEILSPGNKAARAEFRTFVEKSGELLQSGVHLLVADPFPPGPRDPRGIHPAIWEPFDPDDSYAPPADQPLTAAAYDAGGGIDMAAYVEPFAVGDPVPEVPLFLRPGRYVACPLEAAYQETWGVFPAALRRLLEPGG